jgi:hypothetical protein
MIAASRYPGSTGAMAQWGVGGIAMDDAERSYERLSDADLQGLSTLVLVTLNKVFEYASVAGLYRDRLIVLALCQGSAQHYLDGQHGIKDLDVWAFFRAGPPKPFPWRTVWHADFGPSHLGRNPSDDGYSGRRIDIMGRSIPVGVNEAPEEAVHRWLTGYSASAKCLANRPVIGLFPETLFTHRIS